MLYWNAIWVALVTVLPATVAGLLTRRSVERVLLTSGILVVAYVVIGAILMWFFQPNVSFSLTSFYQSFWLWMFGWLIALVAMAFSLSYEGYHEESFKTADMAFWASFIALGAVWAAIFMYGILNIFGGVWTQSRAHQLAAEVHVKQMPLGSYPDTDANHMVIVPEQVARKSASVAMSSDGGKLASTYEIETPVLQSVDGHAYWIVPLKPSSWLNNNKVGGKVPGYIVVDAQDPNAAPTIRTKDAKGNPLSIHYTLDGNFSHKLQRYVWANGYAGTPVDNWTMEVNDQWRPYWTASTNRLTLNFKQTVPDGELVVDAQTGKITRYALGHVPSWIDRIYSANTAKQMVNWWADYSQSPYGFMGMFRGSSGRFQVDGDPTLVYTSEGYPVWQMELSSQNSDSSVAYVGLFNGRTNTLRLYQIPDVALESAVSSAIQGSPKNIRQLNPTHIALHKVYGQLTWVAPLVPNGDADPSTTAIMQGVALAPADSQLNAGSVTIDPTMTQALTDYQSYLDGSTAANPQQNAATKTRTGTVDRVSVPVNQNGVTALYFTLRGSKQYFVVDVNPNSTTPNLEALFIKPGITVRFTYRDVGSQLENVLSYSDNQSSK